MKDHIRGEFVARMNEARHQLKSAGPIHRKDLQRQIANMEKELRVYDKFHREARDGR